MVQIQPGEIVEVLMDEIDLLEAYEKFVDRLVNDPQVGYAVWCQPELVAEYERLKKL